MVPNRDQVLESAKQLRRDGQSHRQIAKVLKIGLGTAVIFTRDIKISWAQHVALKRNGGFFQYTHEQRSVWSSKGGRNWQSHIKYSKADLIKKIQDFYKSNNRIPVKREFYANWRAFHRVFGSWNQAIIASGFTPNEIIFSKKFISKDGHICDSYSEKIIDDWLHSKNIPHLLHIPYPGQKLFKCDFLIHGKYWVEFLGLKGYRSYDRLYIKKLVVAKMANIKIIELNATDLFPKFKIHEKLSHLV